MILIANPSHDTDTAIDILFRSTTDRLASHCRSRAVPGSDLNWKRLGARPPSQYRHQRKPLGTTPASLLRSRDRTRQHGPCGDGAWRGDVDAEPADQPP